MTDKPFTGTFKAGNKPPYLSPSTLFERFTEQIRRQLLSRTSVRGATDDFYYGKAEADAEPYSDREFYDYVLNMNRSLITATTGAEDLVSYMEENKGTARAESVAKYIIGKAAVEPVRSLYRTEQELRAYAYYRELFQIRVTQNSDRL